MPVLITIYPAMIQFPLLHLGWQLPCYPLHAVCKSSHGTKILVGGTPVSAVTVADLDFLFALTGGEISHPDHWFALQKYKIAAGRGSWESQGSAPQQGMQNEGGRFASSSNWLPKCASCPQLALEH